MRGKECWDGGMDLPSDHLSVGQSQCLCYFITVGRGKVLLVEETLFQFEYLVIGEGGARLSFLLHLRCSTVEQVQVV